MKNKAKEELKDVIEDYFYEKTKDFVFNYYEEEEMEKKLLEKIKDCVEDVMDAFEYYDKNVDLFLEDYEFNREENRRDYEYRIKNYEY